MNDEVLFRSSDLSVTYKTITVREISLSIRNVASVQAADTGTGYLACFVLGVGLLICFQFSVLLGTAVAGLRIMTIWYRAERQSLSIVAAGQDYTLLTNEPEARVQQAKAAIEVAMAAA